MTQLKTELAKKETKSIPEALANFDQLPNSQQVRLPVATALLGVSNATLWRMVKAKRINAYKLTERTTSFNVGELRALLAAKAA